MSVVMDLVLRPCDIFHRWFHLHSLVLDMLPVGVLYILLGGDHPKNIITLQCLIRKRKGTDYRKVICYYPKHV